MPTTKDMYRNIEAERARNDYTIEELAKVLGIGEKTFRNWRDNEKVLDGTMLVKLADLFGCSVDYLLGISDKIRP
jgi:transcriptional regulator with XRE-family HTH domain